MPMEDAQVSQLRLEVDQLRNEHTSLRERVSDLSERNMKLETIVGVDDDKRGILAELVEMKSSINALKAWQVKVMAIVGAGATIIQVVIQHFFQK